MYTYKRFKTLKSAVIVILIVLALVAWGVLVPTLLAKKPAGKGGTKIAFEVDIVDHGGPYNSPALVPTCPGVTGEGNLKSAGTFHAKWPEQGIVVIPAGSGYPLTDDPQFIAERHGGEIGSVVFGIQDVTGPDGIMHITDSTPVASPVTPSFDGFIIHVHADDVPVWRLKGHTGGPRVEQIGTISIGDVVFTPVQ